MGAMAGALGVPRGRARASKGAAGAGAGAGAGGGGGGRGGPAGGVGKGPAVVVRTRSGRAAEKGRQTAWERLRDFWHEPSSSKMSIYTHSFILVLIFISVRAGLPFPPPHPARGG